jgi:hypothetical protein
VLDGALRTLGPASFPRKHAKSHNLIINFRQMAAGLFSTKLYFFEIGALFTNLFTNWYWDLDVGRPWGCRGRRSGTSALTGYEGGSGCCLAPYGTAYGRALATTRTRNQYPDLGDAGRGHVAGSRGPLPLHLLVVIPHFRHLCQKSNYLQKSSKVELSSHPTSSKVELSSKDRVPRAPKVDVRRKCHATTLQDTNRFVFLLFLHY